MPDSQLLALFEKKRRENVKFEKLIERFPGYVQELKKTGVTHSCKYEPRINFMFDDFADHYKSVILPARVRRPQDKALVENAVKLVYQRIYAPLRNKIFFSLEELNEAIWDLLEQHNNTQFQRLKISRRGLFEKID